ncbi:hypothetical protein GALL_365960 [mine drainage metagenome]|uniref:Uncharacterized protein n=1 Tax=mine drainage metagenome TaxID=410659 RepID=A0A1J5QDF7_9ZZZZ
MRGTSRGRQLCAAVGHRVGHGERRERPAGRSLRGCQHRRAERRSVRRRGALDPGGAVTDDGAHRDEAGARVGLRRRECRVDRLEVRAVTDALHVPARGREPGQVVVGGRLRGRPVDRDPVVVPQDDEPSQAQVPGQGDRLLADPLHEAAVADQRVGAVIGDLRKPRGLHALGERHAHGHRQALSERSGGGLHPVGVAELGVTRGPRAELAEAAQLVDRQVVAEGVQQPVEERRAVPRAQHEPVTVRPARVGRVVAQVAGEQHPGHRRSTHRQPRVSGLRRLDHVGGEEPQGPDRQGVGPGVPGLRIDGAGRDVDPQLDAHLRPPCRRRRSSRASSRSSPDRAAAAPRRPCPRGRSTTSSRR